MKGRMNSRFVLLAAIAGWLTAGTAVAQPPAPPMPQATKPQSQSENPSPPAPLSAVARRGEQIWKSSKEKYLGALSCSAAACHGSVVADTRPAAKSRRNEYVVWIESDPHSRAHETLWNDRSKIMLERLQIDRGHPGYANCLACHSPEPPPARRGPNYFVGNGVDCESCHGPAEHWGDQHYREDWKLSSAAKSGKTDTRNLAVRADLCVGCHVGDADRQVTHDLIAAGHPVLKFELSSYLALLPKHWRPETSQDFEAKVWSAGQFAAAKANFELLAAQASVAAANQADAVWPEFAQGDCFACHHDLASPGWRQERGLVTGRPGTLPLSRWYVSAFEQAAMASGDAEHGKWAGGVSNLRAMMEASFLPNASAVADAAGDLSKQLHLWQSQKAAAFLANGNAPSHIHQFLRGLAGEQNDHAAPAVVDWDTAAQFYLAAVALNQNALNQKQAGGAGSPEFTEAVKSLRRHLAFPAGFNSPRMFVGQLSPNASPALDAAPSSREAARQAIEKILRLLPETTP